MRTDTLNYLKQQIRCNAFAAITITLACLSTTAYGRYSADNPWTVDEQEKPPVQYVVGFEQHNLNYLHIEATFETQDESTELMLPVWTPGSYLVREFARHIDTFAVKDLDGNELAWKKTKKNRWEVQTADVNSIRVTYRLFCKELTVRTNFVDGQYAVINGAPTFITIPELRDQPHGVQLNLPEKWNRSATSLQAGGQKHQYIAEDFDDLVDSPIVAGKISVYPFSVDGITHQLVNIGESENWDGAAAANDLKQVVQAHHQLWQIVPYDRYLFLNVISDRGGGLEHNNSTLLMTGTWSYRVKERYRDWLSLASHEFFHTWNVRRLRPKALVQYDYENEVYTPSLWIAEGLTSYYEDVLLVRGGLIDPDEYLRRLNSNISSVQKRAGRLKQSLRESSFDTWIKFYRPSSNSSDTQISYYSKGAVVGFLLDAEIQRATDGQNSLDDVMRTMYQRFLETGYTEDDFRNVASEIAGEDLAEFFEKCIDSAVELDFETAKDWYGLKFPHDPDVQDGEGDGESEELTELKELEDQDEDQPSYGGLLEPLSDTENDKPWLGFTLVSGIIDDIEADSPAQAAGLNNGDELIAVDQYRLKGGIEQRLKNYDVGDSMELLIARRQKITARTIVVGSRPKPKTWRLRKAKKASQQQTRHFSAWLGLDQSSDDNEENEDSDK